MNYGLMSLTMSLHLLCIYNSLFPMDYCYILTIFYLGEEEYTPYSRPPLSKQLWLYEDHEAAKQLKFKASWSDGKVVE